MSDHGDRRADTRDVDSGGTRGLLLGLVSLVALTFAWPNGTTTQAASAVGMVTALGLGTAAIVLAVRALMRTQGPATRSPPARSRPSSPGRSPASWRCCCSGCLRCSASTPSSSSAMMQVIVPVTMAEIAPGATASGPCVRISARTASTTAAVPRPREVIIPTADAVWVVVPLGQEKVSATRAISPINNPRVPPESTVRVSARRSPWSVTCDPHVESARGVVPLSSPTVPPTVHATRPRRPIAP